MFTIECLTEMFTEDEIGRGTELFAMEELTVRIAASAEASKYKTEFSDGSAEEMVVLKASVKNPKRLLSWNGKCQVVLDEEHGELLQTECGCEEFYQSRYACPHITGAIVAYLDKRDGREKLENSCLEQILAKRTGVEHPLLPGILRQTDEDLSTLLKSCECRASYVLEMSRTTQEKIKVECYLHRDVVGFRLELKSGTRRAYVIKNIRNFLESYIAGTEHVFGKESLRLLPEAFDESGQIVMDVLSSIYKDGALGTGTRLFSGYGTQESREMLLMGRNLDVFMENIAVNGVFFLDEDVKLKFVPDEMKPELRMTKKEYGAVLKLGNSKMMFQSVHWLYFRKEDKIFRISVKNQPLLEQMLLLLGKNNDIFIGEKDLPEVCRELLPVFQASVQLTFKGMMPEKYLPEKPRFEFYLDYPQENMISCQTYACYQQGKYLLFEQENYKEKRDFQTEHQVGKLVRQMFGAFDSKAATLYLECEEQELYCFLTEGLHRLSELGEIFVSEQLQRLKVVPMSNISVGISIESGLLDMTVSSELFSMTELAEILSAYSAKKKYHRLKNGSFLSFSDAQCQTMSALADCFKNYGKRNQEHISMPLFRALYMDEMLRQKENINFSKSKEYRKLLNNMNAAKNSEHDVPESLGNILRPYQTDGFYWLKTLKENGFGGILADDMGLGKTLQVLTFLLSEKEEGKSGDTLRTLIVTPASLVYNWQKEIEHFAPQLSFRVIAGAALQRKDLIEAGEDADIWITSYDLLKRDVEIYEGIAFANEIIDEAQYIKNQTTLAAKSVRLINSGFRLALTGTPIENRLSELWSIFDYLMPGFLYSYAWFKSEIEAPVVNNRDEEILNKVRRMVHPFILRRLKQDVLKELPEKQEEVVSVHLSGEQRKLYDAYAQRLKLYLDKQSDEEFHHNKLEVLAELTKLRQICCGPELLLEGYKGENAKLDACMELVHQAVEGGHKLLIFSQFTSALDEIGGRLKKDALPFYRIDGSVKKEERMQMVDAFQKDEVPVFCISLKAGGTGLNLTAADIVIHYDPWWNLAAQNQATDRVHRIGQKHAVNVYQLIAENTIEERIQKLQQSKYQLAKDVLSGEGIQSILIDKNEILTLLQQGEGQNT